MYDFKKMEEEILEFWKEKKTFEKLVKKNKGKKRWSFIDGPITANNPMGVHHGWGRTYKDLFQRFKAMQGHELRFQNGFDCQGLWVEREEEKELGLKNKEDIEKFGVLEFVEACRKRVEKFSKIQTEQSIKLGYWMDWENSYYTMSDENNLHNWHLLKTYFDRSMLYKGKDAVPWCWRCGTASSKHDIVTEGYKEVDHKALFMRFPVKEREDEYLLIFTTTPWTVPANVVVAVNEKTTYAKIESGGKKYWIAESRLAEIKGEYEIIERKKGKEMKGMKYEMPYENLEPQERESPPHEVLLWEMASDKEGTGMVHVAPGCGSEDFALGKKEGLPAISPLEESGIYAEGFGKFSGKKYSEVSEEVLKDLEERGFVYKTNGIKHRYPHCWRCGEELVFRLVDEWYVKGNEIRETLMKENEKVRWFPEYGKVRQEDWFENMGDWLISRKRYWGLPLPIWECPCGSVEVFGSLKELRKRAVDKKKVDDLKEIHRPWIDEIKIKCGKCKKEVRRIPDVGDVWLDAGIVPFSTLGYLSDRNHWKKWFPADFITENMPGQCRGWFNALMWAGVALTGKTPFGSVLGHETVKDEKGEEMHKSKGNAIWFDEAIEKMGADVMRLLYCSQNPANELRFGFNVAKEPRNNINVLYNVSRLVEKTGRKNKPAGIEDRWIISRLNSLVKKVTEELEEMRPHAATKELKEFWTRDLSKRYVHVVRERLSDGDESAKAVLKEAYATLLKLCAPIIPFVAEKAWQALKEKGAVSGESVHLCDWPRHENGKIKPAMEEDFEKVFEAIEAGMSERDKNRMGLKWPLNGAEVRCTIRREFRKSMTRVMESMLNVRKIKLKKGEASEISVTLDVKTTPELESEGYAREISRLIQDFRKKLNLKKDEGVETRVTADEELRKILEGRKEFIKKRTNSDVLVFGESEEKFKNETDFKIKEKKGKIAIILNR